MKIRTKLKLMFDKELREEYRERVECATRIEATTNLILMGDCGDCAAQGSYCGHPHRSMSSTDPKLSLEHEALKAMGSSLADDLSMSDEEIAEIMRERIEQIRIAALALSSRGYTVLLRNKRYDTVFLNMEIETSCYKSSGLDPHITLLGD